MYNGTLFQKSVYRSSEQLPFLQKVTKKKTFMTWTDRFEIAWNASEIFAHTHVQVYPGLRNL